MARMSNDHTQELIRERVETRREVIGFVESQQAALNRIREGFYPLSITVARSDPYIGIWNIVIVYNQMIKKCIQIKTDGNDVIQVLFARHAAEPRRIFQAELAVGIGANGPYTWISQRTIEQGWLNKVSQKTIYIRDI